MTYNDFDEVTSVSEDAPNLNVADNTASKVKLTIVVSVMLALTLVVSGYQFGWFSYETSKQEAKAPSSPPAAVAIAHAKTMVMAPHTVLPGTVVSTRDAVVAAETSGKILSVVMPGDVVEAGQSIAEIDPRNAKQLLAQRKAELERLQSLHTYHSDYFARVSLRDERLGIPEIGIAELKSNMETSRADVARAEATLEAAKIDLERTSIKAPFSGRVVSQSIQPGEYAQLGSSIVRLVDTQNLEISAQVPAALVQPLITGTPLSVSGMGKTISAPMRTLVPVGNEVSRTMELRVQLQGSEFLVGTPVRVSLPSAEAKEVVAIPRDAVILRTDTQYVFVVDSDGRAHRKNVQLGYAQGDMVEVIGDVSPTAIVITRGGERLRDGQLVSWSESASNASPIAQLSYK